MKYSDRHKTTDPYTDYTIYVNPRQYERICRRRVQRDRQSLRRWRPRNTYVQISVREEMPQEKHYHPRYDVNQDSTGYAGSSNQRYAYYSQPQYRRKNESTYAATTIVNSADKGAESYSDAATTAAAPSEASSYPCSVIAGSHMHPRRHDIQYKSAEPPVNLGCGDNVVGVKYVTVGNVAPSDESTRIEHVTQPAYAGQDLYSRMGSMVSTCGYVIPSRVAVPEVYGPTVHGAALYAYTVPKAIVPTAGVYPNLEKVAYRAANGREMYAASHVGSEGFMSDSYSGETLSGESCASEAYSAEGYATQVDGRGVYSQMNTPTSAKASDCHKTEGVTELEAYNPINRAVAVNTDIGCGYTQHIVTEARPYQGHIGPLWVDRSKGLVDVSGIQQNHIYSDYVCATDTGNIRH